MVNRKSAEYLIWLTLRSSKPFQVCDEWHISFDAFLAEVGPKPDKFGLGRIDYTKKYEPGNVKWMTRAEMENNKWSSRGFKRPPYTRSYVQTTNIAVPSNTVGGSAEESAAT